MNLSLIGYGQGVVFVEHEVLDPATLFEHPEVDLVNVFHTDLRHEQCPILE